MIGVRLVLQLHHGHELDFLVPWPGEAVPSPRDLIAKMMEEGDLQGYTMALGEPVQARLAWDPQEAVSTITELTTLPGGLELEEQDRQGTKCQICGTPAVMGLDCGACGVLVHGGEPPR